MKAIKRIFDFYLDASIHIAFGVYALVHITDITLGFEVDRHLAWFLFFGSVACYNFVKYGVEAKKYILVANRYHKNIQLVSIIALLIALYHGWFLSLEVWFGVVGLVGLTGLYALPLLPHAKNLRSWGGLKIFIVALVWAGATVILPMLSAEQPMTKDVWVETVQRFIFVLILLIPFEIRDLAFDAPDLKTLPQRYGIANTKIFGSFLSVPFFFLIFLKNSVSSGEAIAAGIVFLILGFLMFITGRRQNRYFASFWVEAISVFWWFLLLLATTYI
ncbi:UbiA prenyltransferase family protein [Zobellia galactanivorans]|uniref:Conserved hypothetical membrane protein n=1 Tax=Zobellia galactanivorans (strain DSM 12802 / CCUG 47099 / CIP 106680 / NCIMB 13871 / Dsij) TaxID=63186 RepID=G0L5Z4_ZOBGA|nr:hypothetical protein [Zobellia galactanivorans]MBU3027755.1 hypothetical protein [Zobellia galactanivorans]CAZ96618.1 conserved hypothetical membrane protein [Zobellia galactanivorans]